MAWSDDYTIVGSMWQETARNGREKMSIRLDNGRRLLAYPARKKNPNSPDWIIYEKKDAAPQRQEMSMPEVNDDDVPF